MSELKATRIKMVYNGEVYDDFGTVPCSQLYFRKEEADKVFAELKQKIIEAQTELELWRDGCIISETHLRELDEKRHSDYKRCLAMSKWCHNQREIYERDSYNWELNNEAVASLRNKANIMRKWHKRWLTLADKYKEGNV